MERSLYHDHFQFEESHWWFLARRKIVTDLFKTLGFSMPRRSLDVGSGAGGILEVLLSYGTVSALEGDDESAAIIRARYGERVTVIPQFFEQAELSEQAFDTITLFDVLEHIEDDTAALGKIFRLLPPGGILVATVPACPFLWSNHDVLNKHFRRYMKADLRRKIEQAGFKIIRISYFNFFLFLPILVLRFLFRLIGRVESDFHVPFDGMNSVLMRIFSSESIFLRRWNFPIGTSLFVVAKKEV